MPTKRIFLNNNNDGNNNNRVIVIESFDLTSKVIVLMVMESVNLANKVTDFINDDEI